MMMKKISSGFNKIQRLMIYDKICFFYRDNKCIYSKNIICLACDDYMQEIAGLDLYQHISIAEIRKNRFQQRLLQFVAFVFSAVALLNSCNKS